ncbi:ABC transporter ATP-binding protein [Lactobacillus selangorensis]|uniref:ABC transporter ATP-binding protein n=1 Tax=Lactobacillus selangorensis TaxID=81857 RepID=A0A0R2FSC8_9LACO|nr:ABC transporter ATP-binding protein [Lactobacillus selangorensis]KRN27996.1 ABC transporter ATP-binding protein [Lactobacillus selangorensis]KRN30533.1 ABC transporter ATP-binding protein [Lactobacillus selangorensis]
MATILDVEHLQKRFGKFQALSDVTLQLHTGEVLGFIGPNGAGKSTTIRIILGILKASGGQANVFDMDAWSHRVQIHDRLAYVPGDVYLWPNLTGGEIIDLMLRLGHHQHTAKTDDLIKKFGLDTTKKAKDYSKGNRQKVALIAAFSADSDLYIFDEPTSGLDPLNEVVFQNCVMALKQEGKSVLLSSHILSEVEKMCDTIAIIRQGKIITSMPLKQMQQLTRNTVVVTTKEPLTGLQSLPGVHDFKADKQPNTWTFAVDSNHLSAVMSKLATAQIQNLQCTPPTLEDLFLRYYQSNPDQQEADTHAHQSI